MLSLYVKIGFSCSLRDGHFPQGLLMMVWRWVFILILMSLLSIGLTTAQTLPLCSARPTYLLLPFVNPSYWCIETSVGGTQSAAGPITALEFGMSGTLYGTRPFTGELVAVSDADSDGLPETVESVVAGLRQPNALAVQQEAVYIAGAGTLYRWQDGVLITLRDDLPTDRGFLPHALLVHEDRLLLGVPAPCDYCIPDDPLHGTVISMALDGSDTQVIARGLRYPAALMAEGGLVWVTDSARDGLRGGNLDEINRMDLDSGTIPDFGWPYCYGIKQVDTIEPTFECEPTEPPAYLLPTHALPVALLRYRGETFIPIQDDILVVLGGGVDNAVIQGHGVVAFEDFGQAVPRIEAILPHNERLFGSGTEPYEPVSDQQHPVLENMATLNRQGTGVWPLRMYDLAVDANGWLFISLSEGRVWALRPNPSA